MGVEVVQLTEVDLAEVQTRAQHPLHAGDRALDPVLGQVRLHLGGRERGRSSVAAPARYLGNRPCRVALNRASDSSTPQRHGVGEPC